jgi:DNA-binding winged helix-turn-helix (wHTH) protein/tetratricopeptide (TPR) repeat protein
VSGTQLIFGPFRLDEVDASLWNGTERLHLAPKSFALLRYLATHPGRLVTKEELLDAVWPDTYVADGVLKVRMREVRAALGDEAGTPKVIETVHRRGYRFIAGVRTDSVAAAAPIELRAASLPPIGREAELARLGEHFAKAIAGDRQIVFVIGEAGIGKTALVDAFLESMPRETVLVGRGQCLDHHGSGEAYLPVLDALGQLCRGPHASDLVDVLRRMAPTWLTQLPWLLSPADRELLLRELQGTTRERMLREMVEALEVLTIEYPLVLVLEDLHWSDPSTLDLLALLAHRRQPARILVVGTYRPVDLILSGHALKGLKQRLTQQRLCAEILLPYLSLKHVGLWLERRLGTSELPLGLAETILERTAGNPLFVVNLVHHMVDRGWLAEANGRYVLEVSLDEVSAEVPDGLRQVIEQQLEGLPSDEARMLEVASLLGLEFTTAGVAAALDREREEVETVCETEAQRGRFLRAAGLADLTDGTVCGRFAFTHSLHRDVLHQRIGAVRRIDLHRRIGEWHERSGASPSELALHFLEAARVGCADKAVTYSVRAAERERSLLAYQEAAYHYEMALKVLPLKPRASDAERCGLLIALGQAQERSGALGRARDTFTQAVELARALGATERLAQSVLGMGGGHHVVARVDDRLLGLLEEAVASLDPRDSPLRACLLARLDTALSPIPGGNERRQALRREAIEMARRLGDPETLLWVFQYTRWGFVGWEDTRELRASAAELEALAERATSMEQVLYLDLMRLGDLHELGETGPAAVAFEKFCRMAEESGILWFNWFALRVRAVRALHEGRFDEAEHVANEALRFGQRMDHPNVAAVFGAQILALRLLQGRFREIEPKVTRWVAENPRLHSTRAGLAYLYLSDGREAAARRELDTLAADDFAAIPRDSVWVMTLARLAEVCAGLADRRHAGVLLDLLSPHADRIIGVGPSIAPMGHGSRYIALLLATLGRFDEAAHLFETALAENERTGSRPWVAYTLRDSAVMLLRRPAAGRGRKADQARAQERLCRALELAHELGMGGLEREIAALRTEPPSSRPRATPLRS